MVILFDWTCERFSFWPHLGFNWGPLHLWYCILPFCHINFWCSPMTILDISFWYRSIGGGIVLIGPVRDFVFGHTRVWTGDLWISSPTVSHCAMATSGFHLWQFQVFNSGAGRMVVVLFWLDLWDTFFLATPGFELGTSTSLVLHSTTVPHQLLIFTSAKFGYLTLVQRDWWWYCSGGTCERISFWPHQGLNWGPLHL